MDGKEEVCLKVITGTVMGLNQAYQYLISEWLSEMLSEESKLSTCALLISLHGDKQFRKTSTEDPVYLFS